MSSAEDQIETTVGPTKVERNTTLATFSGADLARETLRQVTAPVAGGPQRTEHPG